MMYVKHLNRSNLKRFIWFIQFQFYLLALFILLSSYSSKIYTAKVSLENTSPISGFAHGFKDSTWLYIEDLSLSGLIIDSAQIINERFSFSSKSLLVKKAKQYLLRTKTYSDYKYLWVEDKPIVFSGVKGSFNNSLVNGSISQKIFEEYRIITEPFLFQIDSLRRNYGTTDSVVWKRILSLEEELKQQSGYFITHNAESIISSYLLSLHCKSWGLDFTKKLYYSLTLENRNTDFGIAIDRYISLNKDIQIGKQFEDFAQRSIAGKEVRLSSLMGNYILLEFWASWCGPCIKENPNLIKVYNDFKSSGFEIFAVSLDANEMQWKNAIAKDKLPWLNVSDLKGGANEAALIYGVHEIPSNFLIDPNGKIIAMNLRGEQLRIKLKELLSK